jgi:threonine synthase
MTTVDAPSVRVFAFEGGGDDMDGPIKQITTDVKFAKQHGLTSVNSINLGRVTVQTAHFFWSCTSTLSVSPFCVRHARPQPRVPACHAHGACFFAWDAPLPHY